jgi:hypothetical protein
MAPTDVIRTHYVIFLGATASELEQAPIESWDVAVATQMAARVQSFTPLSFCFATFERAPGGLESRLLSMSAPYALNNPEPEA